MLTKIIQAYRTAWHYPKAIGNSKTSAFIDRLLFLGVPFLVSITAFLSAIRYTDILSALLIAFVIHIIITTLTVATTRTEVELVDIYLRKNKKAPLIPQPTHTDTHILDPYTQVAYEFVKTTGSTNRPILAEDGQWIGFGHTLPEEFVHQVIKTSKSQITKALFEELVDSVRSGYAVTYTTKESEDLYLRECPRDTPKAFPITILPPSMESTIENRTTTLAIIPEDLQKYFTHRTT